MSYNAENYRRVKEAFEKKRQKAITDARIREADAYSRLPELIKIDAQLRATGMNVFRIACEGTTDLKEKIAEAKAENARLRDMRTELLASLDLPKDYTDPHYECKACCDTGFIEIKMCDCMKRALIYEGLVSSGVGRLADSQSFENFSLYYYRNSNENYDRMKRAFDFTRSYAENFSMSSENLLFMGGTGLGKTHLSTSVARKVVERGYDVIYESAQNIMSDFENDRFHRGYNSTEAEKSEKYLECELLIIDDLGTEMINSFTSGCLYNIINTRQNRRKPTIISTNLTHRDLIDKYDDRITSRLLGEFRIIMFVGNDIRMQKI